ncbi:ATP-grasp domain-containing protein [Halomonas campisalis]|uniref:ATP-grasp domain-containing protein n=1 Tax=Billgrantia campisalis TaxID=74661 RepID=A0ABS9P3H6_9GAMM|nr:ATP-grasp domain-containing protein [Halomonas campisalis]MCG6656341.1 ATP-grasp domain-containing protein [Halomonas campisalis]MDR5861526.1 ATP-grasp domain-containing protein [Halomonas campisalis]
MMNKPVAIVLGGTIPHKFLIENLRDRGYQTILVDYYENPPAAPSADRHIRESTLDLDAVLDIARHENASLVISGCVDQANVTACYVAEQLGLPAPYSYETSLRVTDKALMKAGMLHAGVPTASYDIVTADQVSSFPCCEHFPKVVKPCDCNGSKGVRKVDNDKELKAALKAACEFSRAGKAIVEDFNHGFEVSGYFFIGSDEVSEIHIKRKSLPSRQGSEALQSFMSIGPEILPESTKINFNNAVKKIAQGFGLKNTPILVQANIDGENIKVIEFAPRVSGGLVFREIKILTSFDLIDAVIDSYLGNEVDTSFVKEPFEKVSVVHLYGTGGIFDHVEGMESLLEDGTVEDFFLHKTPGMPMSCDDLASRNRVMGLIVKFNEPSDLDLKISATLLRLKVVSKCGEDVLRRDVFN